MKGGWASARFNVLDLPDVYVGINPVGLVLGITVDNKELVRTVDKLASALNVRSHRWHWVPLVFVPLDVRSAQGFAGWVRIDYDHRIVLLAENTKGSCGLVVVLVFRYVAECFAVNRQRVVRVNKKAVKRLLIVYVLGILQQVKDVVHLVGANKAKVTQNKGVSLVEFLVVYTADWLESVELYQLALQRADLVLAGED